MDGPAPPGPAPGSGAADTLSGGTAGGARRSDQPGANVIRQMRYLAAFVAVVAVVVVVAARQPAGATSEGPLFGVVNGSLGLSSSDAERMRSGRVGEVRWFLYWQLIEPRRGDYRWGPVDALIGNLASRGIPVLPVLYGSAPYAAKTPETPPLGSSAARRGWERFVRAAVARYGPGGTYWTDPRLYGAQHPGAPEVPVTAWQVWNEPNLIHYFNPRPSVKKYARLLRISDAAVREVDPSAQIILAGMPGLSELHAWTFLARLYRIPGIRSDFDAVALHPYSPTLQDLRSQIRRTRAVMRSHGDSETPLWLTELGWASGRPQGGHGVQKGPEGQARMLTRAFTLVRDHANAWRIDRFFWFEWRDPPAGSQGNCTFCRSSGLVARGGRTKPSWLAFKRFTGAS